MAMFLFIFLTNIYRNIYIPLTTNNQLGDNIERQNATDIWEYAENYLDKKGDNDESISSKLWQTLWIM